MLWVAVVVVAVVADVAVVAVVVVVADVVIVVAAVVAIAAVVFTITHSHFNGEHCFKQQLVVKHLSKIHKYCLF